MKKDEIHLDDINRILFGLAPPQFLLEVFLRTLIIFVLCLITVKWLGKRMSSQGSVTEMTVMIMIGAIISVPMQFPDRGLVQGLVLLLGMLLLYNLINLLGVKNKKVELMLQGHAVMLVKDSRLNLDKMRSSDISKEQLFSQLRGKKIFGLGEVKRVYLEACGTFSVYKEDDPKHGLLIFPVNDLPELNTMTEGDGNKNCCQNCGFVTENKAAAASCKYCNCTTWIKPRKLKTS